MTDQDEPKAEATHTPTRAAEAKTADPKVEGSHTRETADPADRLPEDPDAQNDLA